MPTQSLFHNTPTFSTRNINANSPTSLPSPYNSPILASDLMAFPAGGIKNANTLDELRRALNQLAKDKKAYLDKLQVQVTNNDGDITIIDTNLTEIQADLENVARDLSRKAWESILIIPGRGLSGGGSIAQDRTLHLKISSPAELGGVRSTDTPISDTAVGESGINGHIEVTMHNGYMKVKNNAVELGAKTRGDYIHNITATPADGLTITGGTGEKTTTDLKLTDIHSGQSAILGGVQDVGTNSIVGAPMPAGRIRQVDVPNITRDKFGRITGDSPVTINSANNYNITVTTGHGLAVAGTDATDENTGVVKQNKGANQTFTINHSPAVGTLADTTFTTGIPSSGYTNYSPGFAAGTGNINFPQTLGQLTFDTFGHVKQVTKRTLTYGLNSPLTPINSSTRPYTQGGGSGFDLNVPTEADFGHLVKRVLTLQGNRVLIPTVGNIQLERDTDVTGALGGSGALTVAGNLTVATNKLKVDVSTSRVGINKSNPAYSLDVVGNGQFSTDLVVGGDLQVADEIRHKGDSDTKLVFGTDTITMQAGGNLGIDIHSTGDVGIHGGADNNYRLKVHGTTFLSAGSNKSGLEFKPDTSSYTNAGGQDTGITGYKLRAPYFLSSGGAAQAQFNLAEVYGEASGSDNLTHLRIGTNLATSSTRKPRITIGSLGADSPMVFIKEDGRVGIGTNDPQARLHVMAPTAGNPNLQNNTDNTAANSPSAIFDTTVECRGNLVVKGDFNLQNGITFDGWNLEENTGNVSATGLQDFTNTTDSTSKTTGAVKIAGGLGVAKNITTNSLRATSGGNGSSTGGIILDVADGGAAPALTAVMNLKGYEGRGAGILIQDSVNSASNPSNREWFIGSGYSQSVFNIGYAADGVQTSYAAQTKFSVGTTGNINAVGSITGGGNLTVDGTDHQLKIGGSARFQVLNTLVKSLTSHSVSGDLITFGDNELGNQVTDTTKVSGDFIAGDAGAADTNKLFFDTSEGRLGIGKLNPAYTVDALGPARFSGDVISDSASGAQFNAHYATGKVMSLFHGSSYGVVGTTGNTAVGIRTNNSDRIYITNAGKVGIGTTAPNAGYALTVNGNTRSEGNIFSGGADFDLNNSPRRTLENNSDTTHTEPSGSSRRRALVHNFGDRLEINYAGDYTGGVRVADKYQFDNDGRVGIGTLSPDRTIHAYQSGGGSARLGLQVSNTTAEAGIDFGDTGDLDVGRITYSHSNNYMSFFTNATKRLTITNDGKVGIGTTSPGGKLEVAGEIRTKASVPQVQFIDTATGVSPTRLRMDGGTFRILRSTSGVSGSFSDEQIGFEHSSNGNIAIGEKHLPNDAHYMAFVKKDPVENSYIHTRNELFHMGQANTFSFDGRFKDACASFAVTNSGIDITPFNSADTNYALVNNAGDGNTRIGIVLRRDAGTTSGDASSRGGIIYGSRDKGGALLLNRNITGGPQIYFNNDGSRVAAISTGTPGNNNFEIFTRSEKSETLRRRIAVYKTGAILLNNETYIEDTQQPLDNNPSAVLHLRSNSADHIRFESGSNAHLATIDMDETNGLHIECNSSTASAQKIRLRPDNHSDRGVVVHKDLTEVKGYLRVRSTKDALDNDSFAAINTEGGLQVDKKSHLKGDTQVDGKLTAGKVFKGNITTVNIDSSVPDNAQGNPQLFLDLDAANTFVINVKRDNVILSVNAEENNPGAYYTFIIKNEGNHDINFGQNFFFVGGEPELTTGGSASTPKIDLMSFVCDGTNLYGGISPNLTGSIGA